MDDSTALDALFRPASVVVVGASDDVRKIGGRVVQHLLRYRFPGRLHVVNPSRTTVQGLPAEPTVDALPADPPIDLAIVATRARSTPATVAALAARGVKACVVVSSGFGETDEGGAELETRLFEAVHGTGMRLLGPNCQGVANIGHGFVGSFSSCFGRSVDVPDGSAAVISQSGAMGAVFTELLRPHLDGVRYWAATGNERDLGVADLVGWVVRDPQVRTVAVYLEHIGDARAFAAAARAAIERDATLLVCKSGTTAPGGRAAGSHTGAMAQEDAVVDAFLTRHGVVRVRDPRELSELARVFGRPKRPRGPRVGMVTNSGGLGVLLTDECVRCDLTIAEFTTATLDRLRTVLPDFAAVHNPIDVTAQLLSRPELIAAALEAVVADPGVDVVLLGLAILGEYYDLDRVLADVVAVDAATDKPVVVCWVAGQPGMVERFAAARIPAFDDTTGCARAVGRLVEHTGRRERLRCAAPGPAAELVPAGRTRPLSEYTGKQLARSWGLPVAPGRLARDVDEALAAARELGYPVAAKLSAATVAHKTEHGLVVLGVADDQRLAAVTAELLAADGVEGPLDGVLVEPMVADGLEMTVGVLRDPALGPIVMVGAGGTAAELLGDVRLLVPPVDAHDVREAIGSLALAPLLAGYRGSPARDVDALVELVLAVAATPAVVRGEVTELDLNPVMVLPAGQGVRIVDVSLRVLER